MKHKTRFVCSLFTLMGLVALPQGVDSSETPKTPGLSLRGSSEQEIDSLSLKLEKIAIESTIPGFGVAVVHKDRILYKGGFGYADIEQKVPYTDSTIHNIGSTTKTLIAFSLMKLVEEGRMQLDDPINKYLPFSIKNPYFPATEITIRQLATHTSSLTDGKEDMLIERTYLFQGDIDFDKKELPDEYYPYFKIYRSNKKVSLKKFLKYSYTEGGLWYEKENFLNDKPGTTYKYSNLASALLAYIIERTVKMKFSDYAKKEVFGPLKMYTSYWRLKNIPSRQLASLYMSNGLKIPHYELITYPDGGLFTTVSDFSAFLIEMIKGLNGDGTLLSTKSYKEMMTNQLTAANFPDATFEISKGLFWSVNKDGDNISMNGADPGILSYTLFTTQGNVGIVIFMNNSIYDNEELESDFKKIRATLFQNAKRLLDK
ncbi:beta-lactamase family protein [Maribacter sp.]|nr:beta-lactamase family protein [Maribacter sp.]